METTIESQVQLPPSARDIDAYRLLKVEQKSTRAVAELLGISQTRVCQVIERVATFLIEVAPAAENDTRQGQRLHVARQVAAERVDFLYGQAIRSFKRSQGVHETVRLVEAEGKPAVTIRTTREDFGDPRILMAAARLALFGARLPLACLGGELRPIPTNDSPDTENPLVEECSARAGEQADLADKAEAENVASHSQQMACMNDVLAKARATAVRSAPVQPADSGSQLSPRKREARKAFLAESS